MRLDPLEMRIIALLKERYPVTVEELRDEIRVRPAAITRALRSLTVKGIIVLEPLSDKTYIRLLVPEIILREGDSGRKADDEGHGDGGRDDDDSFTYA